MIGLVCIFRHNPGTPFPIMLFLFKITPGRMSTIGGRDYGMNITKWNVAWLSWNQKTAGRRLDPAISNFLRCPYHENCRQYLRALRDCQIWIDCLSVEIDSVSQCRQVHGLRVMD